MRLPPAIRYQLWFRGPVFRVVGLRVAGSRVSRFRVAGAEKIMSSSFWFPTHLHHRDKTQNHVIIKLKIMGQLILQHLQVQGCRGCRVAGAGLQSCRCRVAGAGLQVQSCRCRVAGVGLQPPHNPT